MVSSVLYVPGSGILPHAWEVGGALGGRMGAVELEGHKEAGWEWELRMVAEGCSVGCMLGWGAGGRLALGAAHVGSTVTSPSVGSDDGDTPWRFRVLPRY